MDNMDYLLKLIKHFEKHTDALNYLLALDKS